MVILNSKEMFKTMYEAQIKDFYSTKKNKRLHERDITIFAEHFATIESK